MRAAVLVLLVGAASSFVEQSEWNSFKLKHAKTYANPIEEFYRMKVYADNKAYVDQHMKEHAEGKHTFTVVLNKFADLTTEEWGRMYKGLKMDSTTHFKTHQMSGKTDPPPSSMDWREYGAVTSVKDQGQCSSAWAFSAVGSLEGAWGRGISLSAQQLVDCTKVPPYLNQGCNGGSVDQAFYYIFMKDGIDSESHYPYEARDSFCRVTGHNVVMQDSWYHIKPYDETDLMEKVGTKNPVAVTIDASKRSFQFYSSGVYNDPSCSGMDLNHNALVVGYGDGYWIVKNSWGTDWGDDGYIYMTRNGSNQCGIATEAYYASV